MQATCKLCGEETGTVTEHTTDFGKCNICGEKINYDYFESVNEYLIMAAKDAEKAAEAINEYRALMNKDPLGYVGAYEENIKIIFGHFSDANVVKAVLAKFLSSKGTPFNLLIKQDIICGKML